jgi:NDP-sugar pyrophosphorylase family protein
MSGQPKKISHAVILAAGRGQRMGPLTDVVPKPMAPLNGSTLIASGIKNLLVSVPKIHITVGYKKAMLAQHVIENGVCSVINTEGQSNSWWIYNSLLRHLNEPLFVLTCDNIIDLDFALLEESYFKLGEPPCMLVPVSPVPGLEGDYIFHDGAVVTGLDRKTPAEIYCSGVQVINPAKINEVTREESDFYSVWRQLIAQRLLMVSAVYPKKWISIDTLEQLTQYGKTVG